MPRTIKARVNERILTEVTRFFGGWDAMLVEMFQNANRAKATKVVVTFNRAEGILTIKDNGLGCDDPQILLDAAATGWNTDEVRAPAGLGFFSLFDPTIIDRVTVCSRDWEFSLLPEQAVTKVIEVKSRRPMKGFQVSLVLREAHLNKMTDYNLLYSIREARAYYGYQVTFNKEPLENPFAGEIKGRIKVSSPYGDFYFNSGGSTIPIWEGRAIPEVDSFNKAMKNEAKTTLECWFARTWGAGRWNIAAPGVIWVINPDCGVQPKLPDRRSLIANGHLTLAVRAMLDAYVALVDDGRWKLYPKVLSKPEDVMLKCGLSDPLTVLKNNSIYPLLLDKGWVTAAVENYSYLPTNAHVSDDSVEVSVHGFEKRYVSLIDRELGIPVDQHLHAVLRLPGQPFAILRDSVDDEEQVDVEIDWNGWDTEDTRSYCYVRPVKSITWNGKPMPFYFIPRSDHEAMQTGVVIAGTPEEVGSLLLASNEVGWMEAVRNWTIFLAGKDNPIAYPSEWVDEDLEELSHDKVQTAIQLNYCEEYLPDLESTLAKLERLGEIDEDMLKARAKVVSGKVGLKDYPELLTQAEDIVEKLDSWRDAYCKLAKELRTKLPVTD